MGIQSNPEVHISDHMISNTSTSDTRADRLLSELLRIPRENLEARVRLLEDQIKERQVLSDQILSTLHTKRARTGDELHRLRYSFVTGLGETHPRNAARTLHELDKSITVEMLTRFGDVAELQRSLQEAQAELREEIKRLDLVTDRTTVI